MTLFSCSKCSFRAQFESALMMHHQLHHEPAPVQVEQKPSTLVKGKPKTTPRMSIFSQESKEKFFKLPGRTSSATRIFDKIKAKICRSKHALFTHAEVHAAAQAPPTPPVLPDLNNLSLAENEMLSPIAPSECTSKALKAESSAPRCIPITSPLTPSRETSTYACHLCPYVADRITVLDRHLLTDHKIGLDNLIRLVLAKTKEGLDTSPDLDIFPITQSYYKPIDDVIEDGEFVYETVSPKIKILRHAATNTNLRWNEIELKDDCRVITTELNKLVAYPTETNENIDFLEKMKSLNECMCKFVDSSNTLKRVLSKKYDSKTSDRGQLGIEPFFNLALGDSTPREWEKAKSEMMERRRRHIDEYGIDVLKLLRLR